MDFFFKTFFSCHVKVIYLSLLLTSVLCVEENQPAIFLSPRNFNPHPYETGYDLRDANKRGPVEFPPTPPDENDLNIPNNRQLNHPVDYHPYPYVAKKRRYKYPGKYRELQSNINPRVYEALSNHAAKVLSEPASQLRKDYTLSSLSNQRKNYAFSYKVVDHLTGDDFSHTQSQNSQATNGEYRVKLPDGRVQIVSYIADKNGYKADVKYTENDISPPNLQIQHGTQIPILKANSYDYQYDHISRSHLPVDLRQYEGNKFFYETTTQHKDYQNYDNEIYRKNSAHFIPNVQPKVEIFTNQGNHALGSFTGTTVAPFLIDSTKGYEGEAVSTVSPDLAHYTPVYNVYK